MNTKKLSASLLLLFIFAGSLFAQQYLSSTISISYDITNIEKTYLPWDEGFEIYQQARKHILRKQWQQAIEKLNKVINEYPKSQYVDDSYYWVGYCRNELEMPKRAFENLQFLVGHYPHSPWRDDAQMLMVEIAEKLVQEGELEYSRYLVNNINQQIININVRLVTLNSLLNLKREFSKHEKVLQEFENAINITLKEREKVRRERKETIQQLRITLKALDKLAERDFLIVIRRPSKKSATPKPDRPDVEVKADLADESETIVIQSIDEIIRESLKAGFIESTAFILSHHFKEKSLPVLVNIALEEPDPYMRSKVVLLIGQVGGVNSFGPLVKIYEATNEPIVKHNIVVSLGRNPSIQSINKLGEIASREENERLRTQAIQWLGRHPSNDSIKVLANAYDAQRYPNTKMQIIRFIGQRRNEIAKKCLTRIAKKEKNIQLKNYAERWLELMQR